EALGAGLAERGTDPVDEDDISTSLWHVNLRGIDVRPMLLTSSKGPALTPRSGRPCSPPAMHARPTRPSDPSDRPAAARPDRPRCPVPAGSASTPAGLRPGR